MALLTELRGLSTKRNIRGRIRSGTSALAKRYHARVEMLRRFTQLVEAEEDFPVIAAKMKDEFGVSDAIRPLNTPYFVVKKKDFTVPGIAEHILTQYATLDPVFDPQPQLYRLPVIFDDDSLESILDYRYQGYLPDSKRSFWSELANGERKCMTLPVIEDPGKRVTGPRIPVANPENQGTCDPMSCGMYQNRKCNLHGSMYFYIPKIPGISAIRLDTNSSIGGELLEAKLRDFLRAGYGLRGVTFFLTKKLVSTKYLNPKSMQLELTKVWVPDIEFPMDFTQSIKSNTATASEALPVIAQTLISHSAPQPIVLTVRELREKLFLELPKSMDYKPEDLSAYGKRLYGDGWSSNQQHLLSILGQLEDWFARAVEITGELSKVPTE